MKTITHRNALKYHGHDFPSMQAGPPNSTSASEALRLDQDAGYFHEPLDSLNANLDDIGTSEHQIATSLMDFLNDEQLSEEEDVEYPEPEGNDDNDDNDVSFDYKMRSKFITFYPPT